MAQKHCPYCGTSLPPESIFCRACGASLRHVGTDDLIASPLDKTIPLPRDMRQTDDASSRSESAWREIVEFNGDSLDPDATITSTRPSSPLTTPASALAPPPVPNRASGAQRASSKDWRWWLVASTCVAALAAVLTLAVLSATHTITPPAAEQTVATGAPVSDAPAESRRLIEEAERLLASGATSDAIERLREAVRLDDRNAQAQLQLGAALERAGKRGEALVFYTAATALAPDDAEAWRRLAEAQFAENRFPEAAQSYRRFFQASGQSLDASASPEGEALRLRFADALRAAGAEEDARTIYVQLSRSAQSSVRRAAQSQLAAMAATEQPAGEQNARQAKTEAMPEERAQGEGRDTNAREVLASPDILPAAPEASPATNPARAERQPTPQERFERAVRMYATDRQNALTEFRGIANLIPDAHYYLGLARTEGRAPRDMHRAELLAALAHFQTASTRGSRYAAQASRLAEQLGREYDRRRKSDR